MQLIEIIRNRRSIRKYTNQRIEKEKLDMILEAGLYAPNPGGRQDAKIILLDDPETIEKIGVVNANCENRGRGGVSKEQPSIMDDLSIKSGFYGCQALAIICIQRSKKDQVNQIGGAFACAQNMTLEAYDLGIGSCIVGRAEATFLQEGMSPYLERWGLDEEYMPIVFVCLGYVNGSYLATKPRKEGRSIFISDKEQEGHDR